MEKIIDFFLEKKNLNTRRPRIAYISDVKHDNARNNAGDSDIYLLNLANRNYPICVAS